MTSDDGHSDLDETPALSGIPSAITKHQHDRRSALGFLGSAVAAAGLATVGLTGCEPGSWVDSRPFSIGKGGYCWFQGPRAAFTPGSSMLWVGSSASNQGSKNGNVLVRGVDVRGRRIASETLIGKAAEDDHAAASVLPLAGGTVLAGWTSRRKDPWFEVGKVGQPMQRIQRLNSSVERGGQGCSYTATFEVGNEIWLLYRGEQWLWNLMRSTDGGTRWSYAGILVDPPWRTRLVDDKLIKENMGYRPYLQAVVHRNELHLLVTEAHPTVFPGCSVYSMIVKRDMTVTDSMGQIIGRVGSAPPLPTSGTLVLPGNAGGSEGRAWLCDLAVSGGAPTAILSIRRGVTHEYWTSRRSGSGQWRNEYLCSGGKALYPWEPDYSGLGTIDRSSHRRVVVSTTVDPRTGRDLVSNKDNKVHWELWEGRSSKLNEWNWTAITSNSASDQIRPVSASSTNGEKALIWMSGTYRSYRDFDTEIMVAKAN